MNRHNKFYRNLADEYYDDYEDDCSEDEEDGYGNYDDDYCEENEKYYDPEDHREPAPVKKTYLTFDESAVDYSVLDTSIPILYSAWQTSFPTQLSLTEAEAVTALRTANYEVEKAATALFEARKSKAGSAKVLKVATTKKPAKVDTTECATGHTDPNNSIGSKTSNAAGGGSVTPTSKRKLKKFLHADCMPDVHRPDCTFVIAGHVDAGKSTTLGHLLLLLGKVSGADVERNAKLGRASHKESFKFAWLLDQSEEERRRGVTIDSGSFCFETKHRRIHILDAPGHKDYVLSMISATTQADAAMLVVTAAPGEFESGIQHGSKEHLLILKTLGVGCIVVAVNKMDAAGYNQTRYEYIVRELKLLLKQLRIPEATIRGYCPISGMEGTNINAVDRSVMPWYEGPSLVDLLDACPLENRLLDAPLRVSLQDVQCNVLFAKVESGRLPRGANLCFIPGDVSVTVKSIEKPTVGGAVNAAFAGETVELHTSSSLVGIYPGCVGCEPNHRVPASATFQAHIQTFSSLERSILPGATFTMVLHALTVSVKVVLLVSKLDKKGVWSSGLVKCVPPNTQAMVMLQAEKPIALTPHEECRALGRFVLQQDNNTVAGGLVKSVVEQRG